MCVDFLDRVDTVLQDQAEGMRVEQVCRMGSCSNASHETRDSCFHTGVATLSDCVMLLCRSGVSTERRVSWNRSSRKRTEPRSRAWCVVPALLSAPSAHCSDVSGPCCEPAHSASA
jgi:hypothetical protein